jgi:hypothetical protein
VGEIEITMCACAFSVDLRMMVRVADDVNGGTYDSLGDTFTIEVGKEIDVVEIYVRGELGGVSYEDMKIPCSNKGPLMPAL